MPFLAETSLVVAASPEAVFARLSDLSAWPGFMPKSFRPVGRCEGKLRVGQKVMVRINGLPPLPIKVRLLDGPREIAWGGGSPLIKGHHRFLFDPTGDGQTRITSSEEWGGLLAPLVKPIVKRLAEKIGREQIEGLAGSLRA